MTALARWFERAAGSDRVVAFGTEGRRSADDLHADVSRLVPVLAPARDGRVLLHCEDSYAFLVGWLGALAVHATPVLPPTRQAGALRRIAAEVAVALIDGPDAPELPTGTPCFSPLHGAGPAEPIAFEPISRDAPVAELFTSGTTGVGRVVPKGLRHLADEVDVLEARFAAEVPADASVLATVSPQHVYGLLFRVLWPLASGRPFLRTPVLHPEELAAHVPAGSPFVIASTPATLRHLAERGEAFADASAIFSSGGPLPADVAASCHARVGVWPFEVYGSTETGGVATRQQDRPDSPWQPMPTVHVERDADSDCLAIASPFVSAGEQLPDGQQRFVTADRFRATDDGFHLAGRADRVVKVGEKRLALADMEARLAEHPSVDEVALVALDREAGVARVGAAVVPVAGAWESMHAGGRRSLTKLLTEHLAPDFDRVLLPRAWRFVTALPRNAQGKLPRAALQALFEAEPSPQVPERLSVERTATALDVRLRVPWDLSFLDGHFPGAPVVAGVVQVHFVMQALEELLGGAPRLERLEALKFHEVLQPGDEARLQVALREDGRRFDFSLVDAERPSRRFCSGRGATRAAS